MYTVYCFLGTAEVAKMQMAASELVENRAVFYGLNANTKYEYQVEAYLRSNQTNSEKSVKMNAATARQFRPGPPKKLKAARGTAADKVELTFELPDLVDIALGDNTYDPKPLYFTISKRIYSESGTNGYQLVCPYFGSNADNAKGKTGSVTFSEYVPNKPVTWTDNITPQTRGITYEYLVQSYVDNNKSSVPSSENAIGWAISNGEVSYGTPKYEFNSEGTLYSEAELPVSFDFDPKGEEYSYTVSAEVEPIDDTYEHNPSAKYSITSTPLVYNIVKNYELKMKLNQKSTQTSPGRGIYSVEVAVSLPGETAPITTFKALGSLQISEDTQPIVVENFRIRDGYKDRFVLIWDNYKNRRYAIEESDNGIDWTHKYFVNDNPDDSDEGITKNYEYPIDGYTPDTTKYFRIRPARKINASEFKSGQPVYAQNVAQTLGVPKLSISAGASYSLITSVWTPAQKADTYRIKYKYTDEGSFTTARTIGIENLTVDATGDYKYSFSPEGYNDVLKAGKEIQIEIEALNEGLRQVVGGGEISTVSMENIKTRLVGPAFLNTDVSKAVSAQEIEVSWDSVEGANGYYIFRRQFNMDNTAEQGSEAVVYYVPSSSATVNIIGKNLALDGSARTDATTVKVSASVTNSRYKLRDIYLPDNEYDGAYSKHTSAYRDQQNDMAQGMTYRYFIVPVIDDTLSAVDFAYNKDTFSGKNTTIASYTIQENGTAINYFGAASLEKDGFTYGFGQNVTATKGTYSSSTTDGRKNNNGIEIKWSAPPRLASGFSPRYTVYRRETISSSWTPITSNYDSTSYVDTTADAGKAYEYTISIKNASGDSTSLPQSSRRFIESCIAQRDDKNRPNMSGYKLGMVKMDSVTRGEDAAVNAEYGEVVKWLGAGISSSYNSDSNWGIDGYEVFVMNRNIDANWHSINSMTSVPNQVSLSVLLTPNNTGSVNNTVGVSRNLLFVLRDFKHFYKVRSYVINGNERIYSPDPDWTYQYRYGTHGNNQTYINAAEQMQNDYVKWGARQITSNEFIRIATLFMADGLDNVNGTGWVYTSLGTRTTNANGSGTGGRVYANSTWGTDWDFEFQNIYRTDVQTRAGDWITFVTLSGKFRARAGASSQYPSRYREYDSGSWIDVGSPPETPNLYSGKIKVGTDGDNNANNLHWGSGRVSIQYPSGTATQNISWRGEDTPLPYTGRGDNRQHNNDWR